MKVLIGLVSLYLIVMILSCAKEITPTPSVVHPQDWNYVNSEVFHGDKVLAAGSESCTQCHGADYQGGTSDISCYQCHSNYPHPQDWTTPGSGHDAYMQQINWAFQSCQVCHGSDYQGGTSSSSCFTCHNETIGLEACNLCHGDYSASISDYTSWAPPEDLTNNISTSAVGVGAHQIHFTGNTWSTAYTLGCTGCHQSINGFYDPVHIDTEPGVNMQFGAVATWNGKVSPQWRKSSASCADVYCHGNFTFNKSESTNQYAYEGSTIRGNNRNLVWNQVGNGQAVCGTCHGLPPTGHILVPACDPCHGSVVDQNNVIIDKNKHMNGLVDLN